MSTSLLAYHDVCKTYGNKTVLDHVNLELPRGKIIGLLGPNGAGKTTLIKLANGLLTPTSGEVTFEDKPIGVTSKHDISYLPERTYLDRGMRVHEAVDYFAEFYDNFDRAKAITLLKDLNLTLDEKILRMSKGMQEKLQLILVMSRQAKLYLLDEPLGGIDPAARDYMLDTILNNFNEGASVVISTHLIADIERVLDEVIFLKAGQIVLQSDADHLRTKKHQSIDEIFRDQFKTHQPTSQAKRS